MRHSRGRHGAATPAATHPQLLTAIRLDTRTKGYVSMLAKNCKRARAGQNRSAAVQTGSGALTPVTAWEQFLISPVWLIWTEEEQPESPSTPHGHAPGRRRRRRTYRLIDGVCVEEVSQQITDPQRQDVAQETRDQAAAGTRTLIETEDTEDTACTRPGPPRAPAWNLGWI